MEPNTTLNPKLPQRKIGSDTIPAIGFGLFSMNSGYTYVEDPAEAEKKHMEVLTKAADAGETFWDTSDVYGPYTNEELIGRWFKLTGRRKEIFLATKFGLYRDPNTRQLCGRGDKAYVRECIEGSLKRLQTDYIDIYYQHRVDKNTRIEDTVSAMAELVKESKVRHLGLSECSAETLRRACKVYPIASIQIEYSLFCLEIEREEIGLKKVCDELGVTIVAYSPLGRGFLAGRFKSRSELVEGDHRLRHPRFSEENFGKNLEIVDRVTEIAKKKGCSSAQLALAWLLKQGENVVPIPGTRQWKYLEENLGALKVEVSEEEEREIREIAEKAEVKGERYPPNAMKMIYGDTI